MCHEQEELENMDLPQLEDCIMKLNDELVSVYSLLDRSKLAFEQGDMPSTLAAREMERGHWEMEVHETKKLLEYHRRQLQETVNPTEEEQEDYETDIRAELKALEQLEPTLILAKEMENAAKVEMLNALQKIQDAFELKCKLESKVLKLSSRRKVLVAKRKLSSVPPNRYLSLNA